jgi:hypothetical protein
MSSARIGVGLAAAAFTGGIAAYRYFKKFKTKSVEKTPIPPQLEEAAPEVIYQEEKPKPASQRTKPFAIDLKAATENIRAALNLATFQLKTMALGGFLLLSGGTQSTYGTGLRYSN